MKKITVYGKTDVGKKRNNNQDSILLNERTMLYAIADGMGGHKGGEIASSMALEIIDMAVTKLIEKNSNVRIPPFLKESISLASMKIYEKALMDESLRGMGTTVISVLFRDDKAYISQVGDSRAYLFRDGNFWKLTEDHSLVNEQVRSGMINRTQAERMSYKNVITRSVGFEEIVAVDIYTREVQSGDVFLLCSDGLTSMLSDSEIRDRVNTDDIKGSVERLISAANEAGGQDNTTVILARVN
ncbi:MAG: Stp1/IreP family PP2C-type Ser/Thr phosphatase [Pseudomonadota bacterium]